MKCEDPGYTFKNTIQVIEPGALSAFLQKKIEDFRFPLDEYPIPELREKEIEYDRMYIPRSVYLIYYSPYDPSSILAVLRIIEKRKTEDNLPIEFSTVVSTNVDSTTCPKKDIVGKPFQVDYYDSRLPVCEAGGLKAAAIDPAKGITMRTRYRALNEIVHLGDKQISDRGYEKVFLSCSCISNMKRVYSEKFFYNEIATVGYNGFPQTWVVYCKTPRRNPMKNTEYSQPSIFSAPDLPWKPSGITTCLLLTDERSSVHKRELEPVR